MIDYLLACGDTHGRYDVVPDYIKKYGLQNCAVFIAGDFGVGFKTNIKDKRRLKYLNDRLKVSNSTVYVVRGNHDSPKYFTGKYDTEFVKLLPDYTIVNINGTNILCVGGAVSIDRTSRKSYYKKNDFDYWENEVFVYNHEIASSVRDIDVVITHSNPNFCYPYTLEGISNQLENDVNLKSDLAVERSNIAKLYETLKQNNNIIKWYYGHYHVSNSMEYDTTKFIALNINEIQEIII